MIHFALATVGFLFGIGFFICFGEKRDLLNILYRRYDGDKWIEWGKMLGEKK